MLAAQRALGAPAMRAGSNATWSCREARCDASDENTKDFARLRRLKVERSRCSEYLFPIAQKERIRFGDTQQEMGRLLGVPVQFAVILVRSHVEECDLATTGRAADRIAERTSAQCRASTPRGSQSR